MSELDKLKETITQLSIVVTDFCGDGYQSDRLGGRYGQANVAHCSGQSC